MVRQHTLNGFNCFKSIKVCFMTYGMALVNIPYTLEKKVLFMMLLDWVFYEYRLDLAGWWYFGSTISLLIIGLQGLSIIKRKVLKYPTIIMDILSSVLSIFLYVFLRGFYVNAHLKLLSSWWLDHFIIA